MIAKGFIGFEISLPMAVGVTLNRQLSHRPQADMSSPERIPDFTSAAARGTGRPWRAVGRYFEETIGQPPAAYHAVA
jgi:hypothetical protein